MFRTMLRGWRTLFNQAPSRRPIRRNPTRTQLRLEQLEDRCLLTSAIIEYSLPTSGAAPGMMALGPDGDVWFTEGGSGINQIAKINTLGTVTEYPLNTNFTTPDDIVQGPDGDMWFTETHTGHWGALGQSTLGGSITDYDFPTGTPSGVYITSTTGTDGSLYFTLGTKIGKLTTSGAFTSYSISMMSALTDVTLGPDGNIWFCDDGSNKIGRMTPTGTVTEWSIPTANADPLRIAPGPDGNLYFTESFANKVGRVTTSGSFTEWTVPTTSSDPIGITDGPDGNVWFVEAAGNKIARMTTSGTFTEWAIPSSSAGATDIVVGSDNNLWFSEGNAKKIGTFKLTGPDYIITPNCDMPDT